METVAQIILGLFIFAIIVAIGIFTVLTIIELFKDMFP